ncbi:hypothetical protein H8B02_06530 [Bradyrhizobium sp. Pear77]|uniref:hypothetical protein n=1 Tax=Bradyrhizobium altum TaxID=1571202 RepID=UPI001E52346A|nr:hypothetical protein [Bradyrhizobium altum]MCC8953135.1 hypothetical protein [Bradyrhizobium altum]
MDWLDSPRFVPQLLAMVAPTGFMISELGARQPKGWSDPRESELVGPHEPFLLPEQQATLTGWWLKHKRGVKLPTWDLAVSALDAEMRKSLILVEAKAHAAELGIAGKSSPKRRKPDEQARSDENHERIAAAIAEANTNLRINSPDIRLSRDSNYQLSNRIAFAWKLASMGIPTALLYLGFIGDENIATDPHHFLTPSDWQAAFDLYSAKHLPVAYQGQRINCGAASFWLLVRSLRVLKQSPSVEYRRKKLNTPR